MKGRWIKLLLILSGVLAAAVAFVLLFRPEEPEYGGEGLSFWLRHLNSPIGCPEHQQASHALRQMGPGVIPVLLRRTSARPPFYDRWYSPAWQKLPGEVQKYFPIPYWLRQGIIAHALTQLGPGALLALCEAYADPKPIHQLVIDGAIREISRHSDATTIPDLLKLSEHPLGEVRGEMAAAFGCMATNVSGQSPAVIAALTRLLADPHPYAREEAAFALWQINRDTNAVSLLVSELEKTSDPKLSLTIFNHFHFIKIAENAYPAISNLVNRSAPLRKLFAPSPFE